VGHHSEAFIGIDTSKSRNAVAIAEGGRGGAVRYFGEIPSSGAAVRKLVAKLAVKYDGLMFCYEAGPTRYGLHRLIKSLGHECMVVAPSLIPKKPGERVKTNRRDAVSLAKVSRAGELTVRSGRPTSDTRPCAISRGPARQRRRTSRASASRLCR
jgi:transposase